jgi:hypothetical protein
MRPHPFASLMGAALVVAVAAAAFAPARAPAVALYWNPIYRAEIALVVLAFAYLLGVAGWMAWHGEAFRRIELPDGAALERDTQELDAAAAGFGEFRDSVDLRLEEIDGALEDLIERVERLETRSTHPERGVP